MARTASYGTCELCGKRTSKAAMGRHLASCVPAHDSAGGKPERLLHLRVQGAWSPMYWLDVEVGARRSLAQLDAFLRDIWLECCGHLSAFEIGGVRYSVAPDDEWLHERGMEARIGNVLEPGVSFRHEYDFGSTTELKLSVKGEREGRAAGGPVRLLARNEAPGWTCDMCGAPATLIDPEASYEGGAFYCDEHAGEATEEDLLLPVVNSPRTGVCAYGTT
ncbi:MAG TPA: hypothetical protein VKA00_08055 [Trueperaceae bacterium]|nr:hypothetical protein [Trueperaceae bacterium]